MNEEDIDDFLAHFGVKGMRWGHRKSKAERIADSTARGEKKYAGKSGARIATEIVGKELAREIALIGGGAAVNALAPKSVALGARFVGSVANLTILVRDIEDARNYVKSRR